MRMTWSVSQSVVASFANLSGIWLTLPAVAWSTWHRCQNRRSQTSRGVVLVVPYRAGSTTYSHGQRRRGRQSTLRRDTPMPYYPASEFEKESWDDLRLIAPDPGGATMKSARLMFVTILPTLLIWLSPMLLWLNLDVLFCVRFAALLYGLGHLYFGRLAKPADRYSSAIIAVLPVLSFFLVIFVSAHDGLLAKAGLFIKLSVNLEYSRSCRPITFIKPTGPQDIGLCPAGIYGDPVDPFTALIYDTSGEIALRPETRTQVWKDAVLHITQPWGQSERESKTYGEALRDNPRWVSHLWGPYYAVTMGRGELS